MFRMILGLCCLLVVKATLALPIHNGDRILFIGNFITQELVSVLPNVLTSANPPVNVVVDTFTQSGAGYSGDLIDQYNSGAALAKIRNGHYTYVVLQGYMNAEDYPAGAKQRFVDAVVGFDNVIKASGAQTVLFWHYINDHFIIEGQYINVTAQVEASYETAAEAIGAPVVPVGMAWTSLTYHPPPNVCGQSVYAGVDFLYDNCGVYDSSLPSEAGNLATAYTFYATLTGKTAVGLNVPGVTISHAIDSALQFRASGIAAMYATGHAYAASALPRGRQLSLVKRQESTTQWFQLNGATVKTGANSSIPAAGLITSRRGMPAAKIFGIAAR
jgi:hypothetical protein